MAVEIMENGSIVIAKSRHAIATIPKQDYEIETISIMSKDKVTVKSHRTMAIVSGQDYTIEAISGILEGNYPLYTGDYNVIPLVEDDIVLPTANRSTIDDITVQKIPYYETSNPSGGYTAIIG